MAKDNFDRCLAITLKWEGGYSNHPDDPGGATMKGVTQGNYNSYRASKGKSKRPVRQLEEAELQEIYRRDYWDAMGCDALASGLDLCVFDAAVNSGVGRAKKWLQGDSSIDSYCARRLSFVQGLGHLWRVFGVGWKHRIFGIRDHAHVMTGAPVVVPVDDGSIHAGMKGEKVLALQVALRNLGYPVGETDGTYGQQVYRAVVVFQTDHELAGEPGVWLPSYDAVLAAAAPMLPKRAEATHKDLEAKGDHMVKGLNILQRVFAWIFGGVTASQVVNGGSVLESMGAARQALDPAVELATWAKGNWFFIAAAGCVIVIAIVRMLRSSHVEAYQNFTYQGQAPKVEAPNA